MPEPSDLIRLLGKRYSEVKEIPATKMLSSEKRQYLLHPVEKRNFHTYRRIHNRFSVVAVDGGYATLFEAPYWGVGYIKLRARKVRFEKNAKEGKTTELNSEDDYVLFLFEKAEGAVEKASIEKGDYLKQRENEFIRKLLKADKLDSEDLLLIDGSLGFQTFYDKEILDLHENTIGISKKSGMMINSFSAASYIALQALKWNVPGPWFYYPLVKKYPSEEAVAEFFYGTFTRTGYCFRVDFPKKVLEEGDPAKTIEDGLSKASMLSIDPKYRGYPYALGVVHSDAVMRPIDRERAQREVESSVMDIKDDEIRELIKRDMENYYWYEKFRNRA
jgi:hypothetical protein